MSRVTARKLWIIAGCWVLSVCLVAWAGILLIASRDAQTGTDVPDGRPDDVSIDAVQRRLVIRKFSGTDPDRRDENGFSQSVQEAIRGVLRVSDRAERIHAITLILSDLGLEEMRGAISFVEGLRAGPSPPRRSSCCSSIPMSNSPRTSPLS